MADRPFENPWASPPIIEGGADQPAPGPGIYADPAYIAAVLAPTMNVDYSTVPGTNASVGPDQVSNVPPSAGVDVYQPGASLEEMIPYWGEQPGRLTRAQLDKLLGEQNMPSGLFALALGERLARMFVSSRRVTRVTRLGRFAGRAMGRLIELAAARLLGPATWAAPARIGALTPVPILAGIAGLLYPRATSSTDVLTPKELEANFLPPIALPPGTGYLGLTASQMITKAPYKSTALLVSPFPGYRIAEPPRELSIGEQIKAGIIAGVRKEFPVLAPLLPGANPNTVGPPRPAVEAAGPPMVGPRQMAGTTPSVTIPGPAPKAPPKWPIQVGLGAASLLGGAAISTLFGGRGSRGTAPLPIVPPAPVQAPVPQPIPSVLVGSSGFYGFGSGACPPCGPRGPRRKCLERGPVRWSGGRNKGKAAGSKCIRFAGRAT